MTDGFTLLLKIEEVTGNAGWRLALRGRWDRRADDVLLSDVTGSLHGATVSAATGRTEFWPRRLLGTIIGPSRIVLDIGTAEGRLALDTEVPLPPYLGITGAGRLIGTGAEREVRVSIDAAQLVGLWLGLHHLLP